MTVVTLKRLFLKPLMKENNIEFTENGVPESPQSPTALPDLPGAAARGRGRPTLELWSAIKADYLIGRGSMRTLAARYGVSSSSLMKRARRERWAANRTLAAATVDTTVVATMQQRAADFVDRSAEATQTFMARIADSEASLQNEDRQGLRLLASTLKDVVAVGRDTFGLGNRDEGKHCIVNLGFLQDYSPEKEISAADCALPV